MPSRVGGLCVNAIIWVYPQPISSASQLWFHVIDEPDDGQLGERHFLLAQYDDPAGELDQVWRVIYAKRSPRPYVLVEDVPEWLFDPRDLTPGMDQQRARQFAYVLERLRGLAAGPGSRR